MGFVRFPKDLSLTHKADRGRGLPLHSLPGEGKGRGSKAEEGWLREGEGGRKEAWRRTGGKGRGEEGGRGEGKHIRGRGGGGGVCISSHVSASSDKRSPDLSSAPRSRSAGIGVEWEGEG